MQQFSNYSTHLPVFEFLLGTFDIRWVLEFGAGLYSTPFLAKRCAHMVSVEQESRQWHDKLAAQITLSNWRIVYEPDPLKIFAELDAARTPVDLVFSDGAAASLCQVANLAMDRGVRLVVLHDAEKVWYYNWNLLRIPQAYSRFNYRHRAGAHKITSVLVNEHAARLDAARVPEHDRVLLAYSSPGQPIVALPYANDAEYRATGRLP